MRKFLLPSVLVASAVAFAAVTYAGGPGCRYKASTASTSSASACAYGKSASLPEGLNIEAIRTPNGALVVFYTSDKPEVVQTLQAKAAGGAESFSCGLCREMAAKDCNIELVTFSEGVLAFVTAEEPETLDLYEKQFAALIGTETDAN